MWYSNDHLITAWELAKCHRDKTIAKAQGKYQYRRKQAVGIAPDPTEELKPHDPE
jgi:hypothetical protein